MITWKNLKIVHEIKSRSLSNGYWADVHDSVGYRFIVREFTYKPTAMKESEEVRAELEVEVDRLWSGLLRWCKAHFGEAFIAWMHIKVGAEEQGKDSVPY